MNLAGFSALTEAQGDQQAVNLLDRFETFTRASLNASGTIVKSIGDALMLAFTDPSVNIAARVAAHAAGDQLLATGAVVDSFRSHALEISSLLELSEHDQVEDYSVLSAVLAPLRAAGRRLAIDDVGAGFSSLRHIVLTAPDVIKLDRTIVAGASTDLVLRTLVRSLVDFGHGCGAAVVAEGIETSQDAIVLRDVGVDYGQGWHFGRPGPPEQLNDYYPVEDAVDRARTVQASQINGT